IGKSRLVADIRHRSRSLGVSKLVGTADAIEKSTPYHAWRSVFRDLFGLEELADDVEARRARVLSMLQESPALLRIAPLLNAVLPLDLPENELTLHLEGKVRADNTHDLLLGLLQQATQRAPLLLILEDTHWLDSASWALTLQLRQRVKPLLLILATRPLTQLPLEYSQLLRAPDTRHMVLENLLPEETLALVCQRLGVSELPEPVAALIREKAEGHPFFSEELAYALRDAGLIRVEGGQCLLNAPPEAFLKASFPNTVQGVITSRIDRLTPQQQLTLKVASVIGRVFPYRTLHDIYPVEQDKPRLSDYLNALKHLDITPLETHGPEPTYLFKHLITQEVVYNLMLFSQRRQLHEAVAAWYEETHTEDLSPFYPLLAYHWDKAENSAKTLFYLEKAGEQALHRGAYHEAVSALRTARQEIEKGQLAIPEVQQGRLALLLGEAYLGLGQVAESGHSLVQATARLGWPMPTTPTRLNLALVQELGKQMGARLRSPHIEQMEPADSQMARLAAARAYQQLAEVFYYANETTSMLYAVLRTVNLAEGQGLSPALAQAYATISVTTGIIPLHSLSRAYWGWSRQVAERLGDPPTLVHVLARTSVYLLGVGEWSTAKEQGQQAASLAEHLGDQLRLAESIAVPAMAARFEGAFAEGARLWDEIHTIARANDNLLHQTWARIGKAQHLFRLGDTETTLALIEETEALLARNADGSSERLAAGMLALVRLRRNEETLALEAAEHCATLLAQSPPVFFTALETYAAVAHVTLRVWERTLQNPLSASLTPRELARRAQAACKALQQYARVFPIGQPSYLLHQGWLDWLSDHEGRARKAWQQSLAAAERLAMPYDAALAHYEIARHLPRDNPARQTHLARACEVFERLGVDHDLAQAQAQLT
ncbi:MAG: AAA family ATPase, partial [Ardenticatenales bacterium]|nr:AAA family ATPase [Ardenticatenales bacterium]